MRLATCLFVTLALGFPGGPLAAAEPDDRPNIIFIMVDDMGWADLSCYGSKAIQTPNIDRMAAEGVRFTDAYSGCTVCAPARSTLMDGKHMGHTSVRLNTGGVPIRDEDVTLAEMLGEAGYTVGGFGKWGIGEVGTEGAAERQGFDTFFGYYHQIHAHYYLPDYLFENGEKVPLPGNAGFYKQFPHGLAGDGGFPRTDAETGLERQYTTDLIFDRTLDFIRDHADDDEPFFCYAPWCPPHGEYKIPNDDPAWLKYADATTPDGTPWPVRAKVVAAYDSMLDRQVGQVLDLLKELEIDNDTIVFFCSDNGGDQDYDTILDSCGPLRGKKRSMHDGGIRVPLIARWPGTIDPARESDLPTYFPDMMPTFAQLAGCETPADIDGLSILPTLTGEGEQAIHDYLYWEWPRYDWGKRTLVPGGLMQGVRAGKWKGVREREGTTLQLFDLSRDIGEQHNLAAEHPEIVERLEAYLTDAHDTMRPQAEPPRVDGKSFR
jgi:arylsulfatase A